MNDFKNNNNDFETQIRKFLKKVGIGSHQLIDNHFNKNNSVISKICIKLEIDNVQIKNFETNIKKWYFCFYSLIHEIFFYIL